MYKSIEYLGEYSKGTHVFTLTDSEFLNTFLIPYHRGMCVSGIVREYEKRNLPVTPNPVTPNIARHYVYLYSKYKWSRDKLFAEIVEDSLSVIQFYPPYKRHLQCLRNQIKRVAYITNAPSII